MKGASLPLAWSHSITDEGRHRNGGKQRHTTYTHFLPPHKVLPVINDVAPACWYNNDPCRGCHDGVDEGDQPGRQTQAWRNNEQKSWPQNRATVSQSVWSNMLIENHLTINQTRIKMVAWFAFGSWSQSPLRWIRTAVQVQYTTTGLAAVHLGVLSLEKLTQVSMKRHEAFTTCL